MLKYIEWMAVAILALVLASCASSGGSDGAVADQDGTNGDGDVSVTDGDSAEGEATESEPEGPGVPPVISDAQIVENPDNPLSAFVNFKTDVPARAEVQVKGPDGSGWTAKAVSDPGTSHEVWILGLKADSAYTFTLRAINQADGGVQENPSQDFATAPLPSPKS